MRKFFLSSLSVFLLNVVAFCQIELIQNGNFSSSSSWNIGGSYWFISSSFSCFSSPSGYAYTGTANGGGANNTFGSINQAITIPSNATSATLTFKTSINTDEATNTVVWDILEPQLRNTSMGLLHTFATYSNLDGARPSTACQQPYQTRTFNIPSSFFGQPLLINFQTASDGSSITKFRIDDVSVTYQTCALPSPPTGLTATVVSDSRIDLTWNSVNGATMYEIDGGFGNCPWSSNGPIQLFTHCNTCTSVSINGLTPGTRYRFIVLAKNACGWSTTFNCISAVTNGSPSQTGSVTASLTPIAAVNAGAQWNIDSGPWQSSGAVVSGVPVGSHTVNFKFVSGWTSPASQSINVTNGATNNVTGIYSQASQTGSVHVTLSPAAAITAGAQWELDGGGWLNSGATLSGISVGNHTVSFKPVSGWTTPATQTVNVTNGATANASGLYTQVSTVPTVNSITFTNKIENHNGIAPLYTLYTGSPTVLTNPIKICADGSAATYFKVNVSNVSGIHFQILDQMGNIVANTASNSSTEPDKYGKMGTPYVFGGNNIELEYTHPQYMDGSGSFKALTLRITFNGTPIPGIDFPLRIYRAPVLFVHGLWGEVNTFLQMENSLINDGLYPQYENILNYTFDSHSPLTQRGDYEVDHANSFSHNSIYMYLFIYKLINRFRSHSFSASKVDVVCHSMGGILAREYLQNRNRVVPYKNDIHRLITLNSPHYGTQVANYLLKPENHLLTVALKNVRNYRCDEGAVDDLKFDSHEIQTYLNIPQASQINKVPSATVATNEGFNSSDPDGFLVGRILADAITDKQIFNSESNDLVVPVSSQRAGLPSIPIDNQWHVGSSRNSNVISRVKSLLNTNPATSPYTSQGFVPGVLTMPNLRIAHVENQLTSDSIKITNITNNQNFHPNDSITVNINFFGNISRVLLMAGNANIEPFAMDTITQTQSVALRLRIPLNAVGKYNLCAIGLDSIKPLAIDTLFINISPTSNLDSIKFNMESLELPVRHRNVFSLSGFYSDGVTRDLSLVPDLQIFEDTTKLKFIGDAKILGIDTGNTVLNVFYQNKTTHLNVHVYSDTTLFQTHFSSNKLLVCQNNSVQFSDQSTGVPLSVAWHFPGGVPSNSTADNPIVVYNSTGTFDVTLIANYPGKIDTLTIPNFISVNPIPAIPVITASAATSFCQGGQVTLTSSVGNEYLWSNGDTTQSIVVSASGNYTVTVFNGSGCSSTSSVTTVSINQSPTATIATSGATNFCQGGSVTLTASPAASYLWNNGATTQSIVVSASGNYFVTVTNGIGCTATSSTIAITAHSLPTATITTSGNTTICQGNSVTLTANTANSYLWSNGATTQSINVTTSGNYSVTVMNASGCTATSTVTSVIVNSLPSAAITASGPTSFCQGNSVTLTATPAFSYLWSNGATSQSINISSSGNYSVAVMNGSGCSATSAITTITVNSLPTAAITASGPITFCQGNSVTLSANAAAGYLWSNGATSQSIIVGSSGNYSVRVTNGNGCSATSPTISITVNPLPAAIFSANPSVCSGVSFADLSYNINAGSPNQYTIQFDVAAISVGFINVTNAALPAGQIRINIPVAVPPGTYNYSMILRNSITGCISSAIAKTITINPIPNISLGNNPSICQGITTANLPYSSTSNSPDQYLITFDAFALSAGFTNVLNATLTTGQIAVKVPAAVSPNTYNGFMYVRNSLTGCVSSGKPFRIEVKPVPLINLDAHVLIYKGARIFLGNRPVATGLAPLTYLWTPATGLNSDTVANPIASPHFSTEYTLKVTDKNGCFASKSIEVAVIGFYVFPIPTKDMVTVYGSEIENGNYTIKVIDIYGTILISKKVSVTSAKMNEQFSIGRFPNGVYFISIEGARQQPPFKVIKIQ